MYCLTTIELNISGFYQLDRLLITIIEKGPVVGPMFYLHNDNWSIFSNVTSVDISIIFDHFLTDFDLTIDFGL